MKRTIKTIERFGITVLDKVQFSATVVLAIFLCLGPWVECLGRDERAQAQRKLILKPSIVESTYCSASNLRLTLTLTFTNAGSEPIILRKEGFFISRYFVSSDLETLIKGKHELNVRGEPGSPMLVKHRLEDKTTVAESRVTTLAPGASHATTVHLYVPYIYDPTHPSPDSLRAGDHVLQLMVWTWLDTESVAARLQEQWRSRGFLWTKSVVSEPVLFKVTDAKSISTCSEE